MGWNYRKSITLIPGVKLNLTGKGASISTGIKGARVSMNTKGVMTNTFSLPGTGISYRKSTKLIGKKKTTAKEEKPTTKTAAAASKAVATKKTKADAQSEEATKAVKGLEEDSVNSKLKDEYVAFVMSAYNENVGRFDWSNLPKKANEYFDDEDIQEMKALAPKVLEGDEEAYYDAINALHPFSAVIEMGCQLDVTVVDSKTLSVHFLVNSAQALKFAKALGTATYNEIVQDFVCGISLGIARDLFYLLPVQIIYIDAEDAGTGVLSVCFDYPHFKSIDLTSVDASDTIENKFVYEMKWSAEKGFQKIEFLDDGRS